AVRRRIPSRRCGPPSEQASALGRSSTCPEVPWLGRRTGPSSRRRGPRWRSPRPRPSPVRWRHSSPSPWGRGECGGRWTPRAVVQALERVPRQVETILRDVGSLARDVAREQIKPENFFYLGRGYGYPVAREGALKLKETSYVHAEAYPSGEFRHGPIALISE